MTERRGFDEGALDLRAQATLRALREDEEIPPDASARVWARLAAATAAEAQEGERPKGQVSRGRSSGTWAAVLIAAAAAVLLVPRLAVLGPSGAGGGEAARYTEERQGAAGQVEAAPGRAQARAASKGTQEAAPADESVRHVPEDVPGGATGQELEASASGQDVKVMSPETGAADPGRVRGERPARPTSKGQATEAKAAVEEAGGLAAEAEALARAQAALQGGRAAEALVELAGYARRFPQGALREEHDALRAIALCTAGRTREGRGEAQVFLQAHSGSALAERVRGACIEP